MIRAVDTNIVIRVLAEPESPQFPTAKAMFDESFMLPASVLMETEWVLRSVMRWPRQRIAEALNDLLDLPTCESVADEIDWVMARYASGADLADMTHVALAQGADRFATFDRDLAKCAGQDTPIPIETLG